MIIFNSAITKLTGAAPWVLAPFTVGSEPVYFYAYGLTDGDKICVQRTVTSSQVSGYVNQGCTTLAPVPGQIMARAPVDTCGSPMCMKLGQASIQVLEPGSYELVGEGPGILAGTVLVEQQVWLGNHEPTTCAKPIEISKLPEIVLAKHVTSSQVVCGELVYVWSDGTNTTEALPECAVEFCASIPLHGGGFGYHEFDVRDPAATVIIEPCAWDTTVDKIYIYPSAGPGHTARQNDCDGVLIGYGVNTSACAVAPAPAPSC